MFKWYCTVGLMVFFCSCASPGSYVINHDHPKPYHVINEKRVDTPTDIVWDNLVKELSKTFFIINNIDKDSRIINVSFFTEDAGDYIDCGNTRLETDITIPPPKKIYRQYNYNTCDDSYVTLGDSIKGNFGTYFPRRKNNRQKNFS
jgi:hypothetical protein